MKESQLVFSRQWWTLIRVLNREDRIQLLDNLMMSYFEGKEPELMSEDAVGAWSQIQKTLNKRAIDKKSHNKLKCAKSESDSEEETRKKEETSSSLDSLSKEENKKKEEGRSAHEKSFDEAFARKYPRLNQMQCPLTFQEYCKMLRKYPYDLIVSILRQMEAYKKIHNYASTYRTCVNWLCREIKRIKEDGRWERYERAMQQQLVQLEKIS